jgi:hypothetical protein
MDNETPKDYKPQGATAIFTPPGATRGKDVIRAQQELSHEEGAFRHSIDPSITPLNPETRRLWEPSAVIHKG